MRSDVSKLRIVAERAEQLRRAVDDGADEVGLVIGELALQHGGDALESHAGIDGGARERRQLAGDVAIVLHEDEIPDLDEAAAGVVRKLFVLAAGFRGFDAKVVVDLGARTAGAGLAHLPEVILLVQAEDAALRNARHLLPELLGFVVLAEDGDVEAVLGEAVVLGDEVPGELDGFGLEVVAEGEVAEHFEKRVVAARVADILEIVVLAAGADAFLRSCGARVVALFQAEEDVLELVHACVGEEQGGVVGGHQRRTANDAVAAFGEEIEKALSDVVTCHGVSFMKGAKFDCTEWRGCGEILGESTE